MSATRPPSEFSIGIIASPTSPLSAAANVSSKLAYGAGSISGRASRQARWLYAPGSPWNPIRSLSAIAFGRVAKWLRSLSDAGACRMSGRR